MNPRGGRAYRKRRIATRLRRNQGIEDARADPGARRLALLSFVLLGLLCAVLVGCATVGHRFNPAQVQEVQIGRTTKSELLGMFGLPYRRGIEDGDSTWTYLHYKFRLFGDHLKTRDLYLRFDSSGRVSSFTYNSNMDD